MRIYFLLFFTIFFLFVPAISMAAPAEVPQSGQTTSYAAGDDGDIQAGVEFPLPRFFDNGDGTVTDNLTELVWLKDANCFIIKEWQEALDAANTLNSGECGLSDGSAEGDWHLPTVCELRSLTNRKYYDPAISNTAGTGQWSEGDPFTGVQSGYYWSSTTYAEDAGGKWCVEMDNGDVVAISRGASEYVWPVRGGQ